MADHRWKGGGAPRSLTIIAAFFLAGPAVAQPAGRWSSYVAEASARFGVPEEWIRRVISAESGGRTLPGGRPIINRAGAMGLMQLMPDRKIVRDVQQRLADMRRDMPAADWRMAVFASRAEHAAWYSHHEPALLTGVEPLLRDTGTDMSEPDKAIRFIGNVSPDG